MKLINQTVLITGGASGIGKIMGRMALDKGARNLVIWDIDEKNMAAVKAEYDPSAPVYCFKVDVSDNESVTKAYADTLKAVGGVDILISCAGIVTSNKPFAQNTPGEIERTIRINTIAPMLVARAVIGDMMACNHGHICTIASAAGMLSNPKMSAYAASKWGAIGWSDSLRIELAADRSRVRVTTVAPYYINTGMFDGVQSKIFPILDPEKTSAKILRAIERDRDFRGIPFGFHFIRFWQAVLPVRIFDWLFGEVFGIYHTMDHFTGRKAA